MDNIYDWNEQYEKTKQAERIEVLQSLNKRSDLDQNMLNEIKELSSMTLLNSLGKIGDYQFVHRDNNVAMRKSSELSQEN